MDYLELYKKAFEDYNPASMKTMQTWYDNNQERIRDRILRPASEGVARWELLEMMIEDRLKLFYPDNEVNLQPRGKKGSDLKFYVSLSEIKGAYSRDSHCGGRITFSDLATKIGTDILHFCSIPHELQMIGSGDLIRKDRPGDTFDLTCFPGLKIRLNPDKKDNPNNNTRIFLNNLVGSSI